LSYTRLSRGQCHLRIEAVNRKRWRRPSAWLRRRFEWRTWTPSSLLRPLTSGGAAGPLRRDGATDRL